MVPVVNGNIAVTVVNGMLEHLIWNYIFNVFVHNFVTETEHPEVWLAGITFVAICTCYSNIVNYIADMLSVFTVCSHHWTENECCDDWHFR